MTTNAYHAFNSFKDVIAEVVHRTGSSDAAVRGSIYASFAQQQLNRKLMTEIQKVDAPLLITNDGLPYPEYPIPVYGYMVIFSLSDIVIDETVVSHTDFQPKHQLNLLRVRKSMYVRDSEAAANTDRIVRVSQEQFDRKLSHNDQDKYYKFAWAYRGGFTTLLYSPIKTNHWRIHYWADFPDITSSLFYGEKHDLSISYDYDYGEIILYAMLKQVYNAQGKIEEAAAVDGYLENLIAMANNDDDEISPPSSQIRFSGATP